MKTHFWFLCFVCLFVNHSLFSQEISNESWRNITGEKYDWTKTMRPEQPYMHPYHQMQVMKIMLSYPDEKGDPVLCYTFEQVLSLVKQMDAVTRGLPKTLYLVGWQYNGHDDKYPAWFEVNNHLKRECDATGVNHCCGWRKKRGNIILILASM